MSVSTTFPLNPELFKGANTSVCAPLTDAGGTDVVTVAEVEGTVVVAVADVDGVVTVVDVVVPVLPDAWYAAAESRRAVVVSLLAVVVVVTVAPVLAEGAGDSTVVWEHAPKPNATVKAARPLNLILSIAQSPSGVR